jgi:hypothetical protein
MAVVLSTTLQPPEPDGSTLRSPAGCYNSEVAGSKAHGIPGAKAVATFRGAKHERPGVVQLANWVGHPFRRLIDLDDEYLVQRALRPFPDFGAEKVGFRDALRALTGALDREARLNFVGRIAAQQDTLRLISTHIRIRRELDEHPEIAQQEVRRPLFIVGLPRTGTTILLALLSQDPAHRPLLFWEGFDPVLPRSGPDRRRRQAASLIQGFDYLCPSYQSIHPMGGELPEECVLLFMHCFTTPQFDFQYHVPSYIEWLQAKGYAEAYRHYRGQLQLLQLQGATAERWLLKDPAHLFALDNILELFPDACVIQTHRDPLKALASNCSLYAHTRSMFSDAVDPDEIGRYVSTGTWTAALERSLRLRQQLPAENFWDLRYADFMRDPITAIEEIYCYFALDLSDSTRDAMRTYLERHPRAGDRVHHYSLEQFGLDPARQRKHFEEYCTRFEIHAEA